MYQRISNAPFEYGNSYGIYGGLWRWEIAKDQQVQLELRTTIPHPYTNPHVYAVTEIRILRTTCDGFTVGLQEAFREKLEIGSDCSSSGRVCFFQATIVQPVRRRIFPADD